MPSAPRPPDPERPCSYKWRAPFTSRQIDHSFFVGNARHATNRVLGELGPTASWASPIDAARCENEMGVRRHLLLWFLLLYGMLYCSFGLSSPFLPEFLTTRGIGAEWLGFLLGAGTA
jgi:hypothetical protein